MGPLTHKEQNRYNSGDQGKGPTNGHIRATLGLPKIYHLETHQQSAMT